MKYALFATLSMLSLLASANDNTAGTTSASAQDVQYDYSHDLDIARIVRTRTAAHAGGDCGPQKAQIEYLDSTGVSHTLEYMRLGDCEKG